MNQNCELKRVADKVALAIKIRAFLPKNAETKKVDTFCNYLIFSGERGNVYIPVYDYK